MCIRDRDWALRVADAAGMSAAQSRLATFDGRAAIVVTRYDRGPDGRRIHQEAVSYTHLDVYKRQGPDRRAVGGRLEADEHAASVPAAGDVEGGLVPDLADVIVRLARGEQVVVAGRHRHLARARASGEGAAEPPRGAADPLGVEGEIPQAIEVAAFASGGVLGLSLIHI